MKKPLTIRVYADFECTNQPQNNPYNPKILFRQIPIAVGYFIDSPFGIFFIHTLEQVAQSGL